MTRVPSRKSQGSGRAGRGPASATLDPRALEALALFVRVLIRCGCQPERIVHEVERVCRRIPTAAAPKAAAALREMDDASHVLTLWFSDPAYLDRAGNPASLPLHGSESLEALTQRVDPKLEVREVLRYLLRRRALRRVGNRYLPRDRVLWLRWARGTDNLGHLRGLVGMLRALEHNGQPNRRGSGWYEVFAENPRFPASARAGFDQRLRTLGNRFVYQIDADLHRRERSRKRGERTVRVGVGVYRFEGGPGPRTRRVSRRK